MLLTLALAPPPPAPAPPAPALALTQAHPLAVVHPAVVVVLGTAERPACATAAAPGAVAVDASLGAAADRAAGLGADLWAAAFVHQPAVDRSVRESDRGATDMIAQEFEVDMLRFGWENSRRQKVEGRGFIMTVRVLARWCST